MYVSSFFVTVKSQRSILKNESISFENSTGSIHTHFDWMEEVRKVMKESGGQFTNAYKRRLSEDAETISILTMVSLTRMTTIAANIILAFIVVMSFGEDASYGLTVPRMRKRELPFYNQWLDLHSMSNEK
jgi:hypothetical protein